MSSLPNLLPSVTSTPTHVVSLCRQLSKLSAPATLSGATLTRAITFPHPLVVPSAVVAATLSGATLTRTITFPRPLVVPSAVVAAITVAILGGYYGDLPPPPPALCRGSGRHCLLAVPRPALLQRCSTTYGCNSLQHLSPQRYATTPLSTRRQLLNLIRCNPALIFPMRPALSDTRSYDVVRQSYV
jgi:hypothetical protein